MRTSFAFLLYGAWLIALPAHAQSRPSDPVQRDARVLEMKYESAFRTYNPYREEDLGSWREVNDEVGRVGGHVGMFRSAGHGAREQEPMKPQAGAPASRAQDTPGQAPSRGEPTAPQSHRMPR